MLYAQLTTGNPIVITSKTTPEEKTQKVELYASTRTTSPYVHLKDSPPEAPEGCSEG
ncbi:MAG: hypothetical protein R6U44_10150 [Archaeoglobaceae archaeon]